MKEEFLQAFDQYSDAIFRFCYVKTSNVERAEDITQDVFMRYWQSLRSGKEMSNTRAFLYTIARNAIIDWYRKHKDDSLDTLQASGFEPSDKNISNGVEVQAQFAEALAAMEDLADADRELLILRYVEGMEPREIAAIVSSNANAVSVRIHRAEGRLREMLGITI